MLTAVRFVHGWQGYNAGEIAGFDETTCHKLINSGIAELHRPTPESATTRDLAGPPANRAIRSPRTKSIK